MKNKKTNTEMMTEKSYIGDSVYIEINRWGQIVLTTENGYGPTNTIMLEPEVYTGLINYVNRSKAEGRDDE